MTPTLLLTRPEAQSLALLAALRRRGVEPEAVLSPIMEVQLRAVRPAGGYAGYILTSQNAVAALPAGAPFVFCVGDATAEAARKAGHRTVSAGGDVEALLRLVRAAAPVGPLLHLRGAHSVGDLAPRLREAGIAAEESVVYDQVARPLSAEAAELLAEERPVLLPLFSPRSAGLVAEHAGPWRAPLDVVALSLRVAEAWRRPTRTLCVLPEPTRAAMLDALARCLSARG